jgi:putative endonuclease
MLTKVSIQSHERRPMPKQPAVYILASDRNGTLYVGVTSDLLGRVYQHRTKAVAGFTARYDVDRLIWFEMHETMESAILREKQLKAWRRAWKLELIKADNPLWRDLAEDLGFDPLPSSRT